MESSSQHFVCIFSLETYDFMNSMIKTTQKCLYPRIDNQRNGLETRYDWDANSVIRAIT